MTNQGKLVAVAFGAALTRMELFAEEFERLATNPAQTKAAATFRAFVTELVTAWESKQPGKGAGKFDCAN